MEGSLAVDFLRRRRGLCRIQLRFPDCETLWSVRVSINHLLMWFRMFGRWGGGCFHGNPHPLSQSWSGSLHASSRGSKVLTSISLWVWVIWKGCSPCQSCLDWQTVFVVLVALCLWGCLCLADMDESLGGSNSRLSADTPVSPVMFCHAPNA